MRTSRPSLIPDDRLENGSPPRFCPACLRAVEYGRTLCEACGERVCDAGFCSICAGYWTLEVGQPCPKHDIEMEIDPDREAVELSHARLVTIHTYAQTSEAQGPRLRLEAEGIPVFLEGERMGVNSIYQVATGGVKLQVPEDQASEARILLSQVWSTSTKLDPEDDPWEGLEPELTEQFRRILKGAILLILFGPIVLWLFSRLLE